MLWIFLLSQLDQHNLTQEERGAKLGLKHEHFHHSVHSNRLTVFIFSVHSEQCVYTIKRFLGCWLKCFLSCYFTGQNLEGQAEKSTVTLSYTWELSAGKNPKGGGLFWAEASDTWVMLHSINMLASKLGSLLKVSLEGWL